MQLLIDGLEKICEIQHLSGHQGPIVQKEEGYCEVCFKDEVSNANSIVFCDICNIGVHQVCVL